MDQQMVKEKLGVLMNPCACGSGKMFFMCCGGDQAREIENEMCPCGSGRMVKNCCMRSPEAHKEMMQ